MEVNACSLGVNPCRFSFNSTPVAMDLILMDPMSSPVASLTATVAALPLAMPLADTRENRDNSRMVLRMMSKLSADNARVHRHAGTCPANHALFNDKGVKRGQKLPTGIERGEFHSAARNRRLTAGERDDVSCGLHELLAPATRAISCGSRWT